MLNSCPMLVVRHWLARIACMLAINSTTTAKSEDKFPREPVTRARYFPFLPYFLFSSRTVDPGYFLSNAAAAFSMSGSILRARFSTDSDWVESVLFSPRVTQPTSLLSSFKPSTKFFVFGTKILPKYLFRTSKISTLAEK